MQKKFFLLFFVTLFMLIGFAFAVDTNGNSLVQVPVIDSNITPDLNILVCAQDSKVCPNGVIVGRNADLNCDFNVCPPTPVICSSDRDCNSSGFRTPYCAATNSCIAQVVSLCLNPGTVLSRCDSNQVVLCTTCQNGCSNGLCNPDLNSLQPPSPPIIIPEPPIPQPKKVNCQNTTLDSDVFTPGIIYGSGNVIGPSFTVGPDSLEISSDYQTIKVKVNGTWLTADVAGYLWIPGEAELRITTIDLKSRTATVVYDSHSSHCIDSSTLLKYDCSVDGFQRTVQCVNGCSGGACIRDGNNTVSTNLLNIDFGVWDTYPSSKIGAAVVGNSGDYWNTVVKAWDDAYTKSNLKYANQEMSVIKVTSINLGGSWGNDGKNGVKDQMLNSYSYQQNNQGGNSQVVLSNLPVGIYTLYIYGNNQGQETGDYEVSTDGLSYGRKTTLASSDAVTKTNWIEDLQYVKFSDLQTSQGKITIDIRPGNSPLGDAIIAGLQLEKQSSLTNMRNTSTVATPQSTTPTTSTSYQTATQSPTYQATAQTPTYQSNIQTPIYQTTTQTPANATNPASVSQQLTTINCANSCSYENKCYPFGYRKNNLFCLDANSTFTEQLATDTVCNNNFECQSNICAAGKCVSQGLLEQIINFFKSLFLK